MGSMLFEVLNSQQVLGANNLFQEDLNFTEAFTYNADRTSNTTLIHMLEEMSSTAGEDVETLDSLCSKLPALKDQKNEPNASIRKSQPRALVADFCKDDIFRDQCLRTDSPDNLQTIASRLPGRASILAQYPSMSQNSDPTSTLVSVEHFVEAQNEARLAQSSYATLDECSTSTALHAPLSRTKRASLSVRAESASVDVSELAENYTCEQPKSGVLVEGAVPVPERRKRKRTRTCKNSQEVEYQRMTHIAVERNRRKQMNEHLSVLRTLMPSSYIQRGDQASIIGGAIEFVKELEQVLQSLEMQRQRRDYGDGTLNAGQLEGLLSDLIMSSQFDLDTTSHVNMKYMTGISSYQPAKELVAESKSVVANVEVTMVGSCGALVKVLAQKRPRQLLHTLAALDSLHLTILHLNITTIDHTVLYSFNLEMGVDCRLHSVSQLASSIQNIFTMFSTQSR